MTDPDTYTPERTTLSFYLPILKCTVRATLTSIASRLLLPNIRIIR